MIVSIRILAGRYLVITLHLLFQRTDA